MSNATHLLVRFITIQKRIAEFCLPQAYAPQILMQHISWQVLCEIGVKNISCGQFIDEEHFATVSLSGLTSLWNVGTGNCIWKNQSQHGELYVDLCKA